MERNCRKESAMKHVAEVGSSVIFVAELDRSVDFYRRVFDCETAILDPGAALLLSPGGFQIYLVARGRGSQHPSGGIGVQYLIWSVDSSESLEQFDQAFKDQCLHTDAYASGSVNFISTRDPDGIPVVIAYPSPKALPRSVLSPRIYEW
jgi:catechol 2,3-dioxygenase-like lactoylglutathione lyase family enzyme